MCEFKDLAFLRNTKIWRLEAYKRSGVQKSWPCHLSSKLDQEQISDFLTPSQEFSLWDHTQALRQWSGSGLGSFAQQCKPISMNQARFFLYWSGATRDKSQPVQLIFWKQEFGSFFKHSLKKYQLILQGNCSPMLYWDKGVCGALVRGMALTLSPHQLWDHGPEKDHSWWEQKISPKAGVGGWRIRAETF